MTEELESRGRNPAYRGCSMITDAQLESRAGWPQLRCGCTSRTTTSSQGEAMTVKLNQPGFDHARDLVVAGRYVIDERDAWSEHQPSTQQENEFIRQHGIGDYAKWHLGIDDQQDSENKGRYKFPYGDFEKVHRCGLLAAESRAGQRKYYDIELAVAHLHGMLEAVRLST